MSPTALQITCMSKAWWDPIESNVIMLYIMHYITNINKSKSLH